MEKKINELEWLESFEYFGIAYFVKPNQQRSKTTLCIKKSGGEIREFNNEIIVKTYR